MHTTVLITGSSQGIGFALANLFLEQGYHVIGTSRTGKIAIDHQNFTAIALDLSKSEGISTSCKQIKDLGKPIDILINNAGIGPDLNVTLPEEDSYRRTLEVNTTGTVFFTEQLLPVVYRNGKLINVSSKMGSITLTEPSCSVAYRMSKAALNMYSKILVNRLQGAPKVGVIHPGWVRTMISGDDTSGRLSPEESAKGIFDFVTSDFKNGMFWNVETQSEIPW
ncbi:SDR family NAD(P)-dependent oxidoreductase [Aquimarina gracilis]|uniref:SDR family NAD(P)-dependent oxidoreductase n=1 Tax=Aquimarina gracilis TaxID=874422 RepID=A0ABU6A1Z7_9FLAO|nr:SDR family NAD(P)-dependent oxidoreductase [Aquimarina gracilis]MEB3348139.1 SDR family NAD(P)-dependent oxidoreductase [Aquimarina gracilis]